MPKTCIIIAGPTAVGKTAIALQLAQHFSTDIISADSRQCYRELGIGVAKPSTEELALVKHYFIDSHSIHDEVTAAGFEQYALQAADEIFSRRDIAVMVGGTGLYIRAFMKGMDPIPASDPVIRQQVQHQYENKGFDWLKDELQTHDPFYCLHGEMKNPQRMMRALEVVLSTGTGILQQQTHQLKQRPFNIILLGLDLPRDILYGRINRRVDTMIEEGLVEEARSLYPYRHLNALQTVGYRELFPCLEKGEIDPANLSRAIELIKQNTRHYAKRQLTWFRREETMHWIKPELKEVLQAAESRM